MQTMRWYLFLPRCTIYRINQRWITCLVPHVLSWPTCFVPYMLSCSTCLVPYVLSCLTCLVPYVLSCPTCLVPYVSCVLCGLVPHALGALFPYVLYCQYYCEVTISIYQQHGYIWIIWNELRKYIHKKLLIILV